MLKKFFINRGIIYVMICIISLAADDVLRSRASLITALEFVAFVYVLLIVLNAIIEIVFDKIKKRKR